MRHIHCVIIWQLGTNSPIMYDSQLICQKNNIKIVQMEKRCIMCRNLDETCGKSLYGLYALQIAQCTWHEYLVPLYNLTGKMSNPNYHKVWLYNLTFNMLELMDRVTSQYMVYCSAYGVPLFHWWHHNTRSIVLIIMSYCFISDIIHAPLFC